MGTDHRGTPVGTPHTSTPLEETKTRLRGTLAKHVKDLPESEPERPPVRTIPGTRIRTTMPEKPEPKNETVVRTIPGTRIRTTMPEPK